MTILTARRSARISATKLGGRTSAPIEPITRNEAPAPTEPPTASPAYSPATYSGGMSLAFHKLATKNPVLLNLAGVLDLVETYSTTVKPQPLPGLIEPVATEPLNPKLLEIAQKSFARSRSYSKDEAVSRLSTVTAVEPDRARNGISKMYAQRILSLTLSNEYYLTESTPF